VSLGQEELVAASVPALFKKVENALVEQRRTFRTETQNSSNEQSENRNPFAMQGVNTCAVKFLIRVGATDHVFVFVKCRSSSDCISADRDTRHVGSRQSSCATSRNATVVSTNP